MSRSGYNEYCIGDEWQMICWRGAVASATRGQRGQKFLKGLRQTLLEMPSKRLLANGFEENGEVCVLGAEMRNRGIHRPNANDVDAEQVGSMLGIAHALAAEIMYQNDDHDSWGLRNRTPEQRYTDMLSWVESQIK